MAFAGEENDISRSANPQNQNFSHNTNRTIATNQHLRERSLSATVEIDSNRSKRNGITAELGNTDEPASKRRKISKNGRSLNSREPSIGQANLDRIIDRKLNFQTTPRNRRYRRAELDSTQSFNPITIERNIQTNRRTREEYTNFEETSRNGTLSQHSAVSPHQYRRPLTIDPRQQHINLETNGLGNHNTDVPISNANANIRISTDITEVDGMGSNRARRQVTQTNTTQVNPTNSDQQHNSESDEFKLENDNKNNHQNRSRRYNMRTDRDEIGGNNEETNGENSNHNNNHNGNNTDNTNNNGNGQRRTNNSDNQSTDNSDNGNNNNQDSRNGRRPWLRPQPSTNPDMERMQNGFIREIHEMRSAVERQTRDIQASEVRQDERIKGTLRLIDNLGAKMTTAFTEVGTLILNNNNNNRNDESAIAAKMKAKLMIETVLKPKFEITGQEDEVTRLDNRRQIEVYRDETKRLLGSKYNDNLTALALYGTLTGNIAEAARALTTAYFTTTNKFLRFYDQHCPYSSEAIRSITDMIRRRPRLTVNDRDALLTLISKHNLLKKQHAYAMQQANEAMEDRMKISDLEHVQIVYGQLPDKWQSQVKQMNNGLAPRTWDTLATLILDLYEELQYTADATRARNEAYLLARNAMKYQISKNNTITGHAQSDMVDESPQRQTAFGVNLVNNNPRWNNNKSARGGFNGNGKSGRYNNNYNNNKQGGYGGRGGNNNNNKNNQRGRSRGGYNNQGNRGNNRGNNRENIKEMFADNSGPSLRPFKIGVRIPGVLMRLFKKLTFDKCYYKVLCDQCKRGGHSKWLCAYLHAIRQQWLNMYEVSYQKQLSKPEYNKTAGNGRGFSVNNVSQDNNDNKSFQEAIGAKTWAAQVSKLSKGSTDGWTTNQKASFVDKLMDNLGKDNELQKKSKKQ